nr:DndE family protein [Clostridia bacterium]
MITRLRTSKESKERLVYLNTVLRMSSYAIILRYAVMRSVLVDKNVEGDPDAKVLNYGGFEITRKTLFGDNEIIYKLLTNSELIDDEDFFPKRINMHIERGLKLMEGDYKLSGNKERFIKNYINKIEE